MAQVPHERGLVERLKGQPFALLGVDCEENKDAARGVMARERMTWPNWFDGDAGTGPIARRYHIRGYPRVFILDARGVIRHRTVSSVGLDDAVDKLLAEMKGPISGQGTSRPGPRSMYRPDHSRRRRPSTGGKPDHHGPWVWRRKPRARHRWVTCGAGTARPSAARSRAAKDCT